uniref:CBM21 domain-containing protein n=1 Tax=Onchocerca volvulus TaxID=6282 RepID=A0A8R1TW68_ONCVO
MNTIMTGKKMAMNLHSMAIDVRPYSEQTTLQSLITKINHQSLLELKLQIDNNHVADKVLWTIDTSKESSPPSAEPFKRIRNDDSGFSSDDNMQSTIEKGNNLMIRSKSLRSALRSSSTKNLSTRKTVHFADSFGLDLVHQNFYEANDFSIELEKFGAKFSPLATKIIKRPQNVILSLVKCQERTDAEISHLTRIQSVCLQCVKFVDMNIIGTINVSNIAYEKQVYVRYTVDNWRTNIETAGRYTNSVENGAIDKFTFIISLPIDFPIGATCEFCIRYVVKGTIYWDNNYGANYIIRAIENIPSEMKFKMNLASKSLQPSDNAYSHNKIKETRSYNDFYYPNRFNSLPFSWQLTNRNNRRNDYMQIDKDYLFRISQNHEGCKNFASSRSAKL